MKKAVLALFAALLIIALTACGSDKTANDKDTGKYDVDLTTMSSTMVYSQVNDMIRSPEKYLGKTVKMSGDFGIYEGDERNYYACVIADATACCSQGIEFVLEGEHKYPEDYPEIGDEITVVGVFDTYQEDELVFCQLINARIV